MKKQYSEPYFDVKTLDFCDVVRCSGGDNDTGWDSEWNDLLGG